MADITDTNLISRLKQYLGLRGRAITSSRNSVYPVIVVNPNELPVALSAPSIPYGATNILGYASKGAATTGALYTVPAGKVGYIIATSLQNNAAAGAYLQINNAAVVVFILAGTTTSGAYILNNPSVAFRLPAGYSVNWNVSAGGGAEFSWYGWEQDA